MKEFKNIKNIIFDCDGVLYKDLDAVFGQVSKKMGEYISRKLNVDLKKAKELQRNYFHQYNTSHISNLSKRYYGKKKRNSYNFCK